MSRHRGYCFTINNYTDDDVSRLDKLDCEYIVYGREVAPTTGTPHIQGYIHFANGKSPNAARKLVKGHLIVAKGTPEQNFDYCSKEGNYTERGNRPQSPQAQGNVERQRWDDARLAARQGRFDDIPSDLYIRYNNSLKRIRREDVAAPANLPPANTYGVWLYGPPRTGKSTMARTQYGTPYLKGINKWWDGYDGEETVLIEDFSPRHAVFLVDYLKIWTDRWTFSAETKGGRIVIRPKLIVITSNYHPDQCFYGVDLEALKSRFTILELKSENAGKETQVCSGPPSL